MVTLLNDDARRIHPRVGAPQRRDHAIAPAIRRPKIDKQNLVFIMVDHRIELDSKIDEIKAAQLAFEDRILQMIAPAAHDLKDLTEAFIIRDIVGDKVGSAHKEERLYSVGPPSSLVHFTPLSLYTSLVKCESLPIFM